jgi:hypothetical protein
VYSPAEDKVHPAGALTWHDTEVLGSMTAMLQLASPDIMMSNSRTVALLLMTAAFVQLSIPAA